MIYDIRNYILQKSNGPAILPCHPIEFKVRYEMIHKKD